MKEPKFKVGDRAYVATPIGIAPCKITKVNKLSYCFIADGAQKGLEVKKDQVFSTMYDAILYVESRSGFQESESK